MSGPAFGADGAASAAAIPGWAHTYSGKVRDLYRPAEPAVESSRSVLVVASDRISAFDQVLPTTIPDKGAILTAMSRWWFAELGDIVPNHVIDPESDAGSVPEQVRGRALVCTRLEMFPVECVVRGYLTGSGLADYNSTGAVCGIPLPAGLVDGDRIEDPIFTPARKADLGEHDENIDLARAEALVGRDAARGLRDLTLALYSRARELARERGIILADTKFEFGRDPTSGEITLGDEVLTPDSSRFWDADRWDPGGAQPSFDKQFVRDWLTSDEAGWDRVSPAPELPERIVDLTRARYVTAYERLTGLSFD